MTSSHPTCIDHGRSSPRYLSARRDTVPTYRHRLVYIDTHGLSLADIHGKVVRHTCDNPRCINPDHLVLGTQSDNMRDMTERKRHPSIYLTDHYATIRASYVRGSSEAGQAALAKKYGTCQSHIGRIVNN